MTSFLRFSRPVARLALVGVLAGVLSCDDPFGPEEYVGTYALQSLSGGPLPAVIANSSELYVAVLADTLRLTGETTGVWETHYEWSSTMQPLTEFVSTVPLAVQRLGNKLLIAELWECPVNASCAPPVAREVEIRGAELLVTTRTGPHRFTLVSRGF